VKNNSGVRSTQSNARPHKESNAMSIKEVLLRFLLLYTVLIVAAGSLIHHFGITQILGVNIGILAGCVSWVCYEFVKRNGRYFSKREKKTVVLGLAAINITLQFLFTASALSQSPTGISAMALIFPVAFISCLQTIVIYFLVCSAKKLLI
jgi:hypothetical protein